MKSVAPLLFSSLAMTLVMQPAAALAIDVMAATPVVLKAPFTASDLLWMEVRAGDLQLAETMDVYSSRAGVFVPLAQFSRVLDLAITVLPPERRAEGWILSRERGLVVDVKTSTATVAGRSVAFDGEQAVLYQDDIYLRTDLAEKLLPVRLHADPAAQLLTVTSTEPLPFEQRAERSQLQSGLSASQPKSVVMPVALPHAAFSEPVFDVNLGGQAARATSDQNHQYSVRVASDLAYAGFRGFVGSDEHGKINDVRLSLERKSPDGHALGMLGGVRVAIGDVFSPLA